MREHVLSLIEITYAQNEEAIAASGDPRAERCAVAMGRISRQLEPLLELAQELAGQLRAVHSIGAARGRGLRAEDLAVLDRPICELLENTPMSTGAGVAIAPNLLEAPELCMQWWVAATSPPRTPRRPARRPPTCCRPSLTPMVSRSASSPHTGRSRAAIRFPGSLSADGLNRVRSTWLKHAGTVSPPAEA